MEQQIHKKSKQNNFDLIYKISDSFTENPQQVSTELFKLTQVCSDLIWEKQFTELIELKRTLNDELMNQTITDYHSYNVGKAHALIEMINLLQKSYDIQNLSKMLEPIEINILRFIEERKESTPSEIKKHFSLDNQEYILNLHKNDLINQYTVAQHRWYSLTLKGQQILLLNKLTDNP